MSVLIFIVGAIAVMLGVGMVGYGIPINEFSFGNTLIVAGTTATVGGLMVIAIGVAVAQLQTISKAFTAGTLARPGQPLDTFEPPTALRAALAAGRIPFPPKPQPETGLREPLPLDARMPTLPPAEMPPDERTGAASAPVLRNPDMSSVEEYDEVSLSPKYAMAAPAPGHADYGEATRPAPPLGINGSGTAGRRHDVAPDTAWRSPPAPTSQTQIRPPQSNHFDSMWPVEPKPNKGAAGYEARLEPASNLPSREAAATPEVREPHPGSEPRTVAILKSGVVDGMGYTLYVDGSIEAELAQGTLRFASINDLRNHLSKSA